MNVFNLKVLLHEQVIQRIKIENGQKDKSKTSKTIN